MIRWIALFFSSAGFSGFLPGIINPRFKGKGGGLIGSIVALPFLYMLWEWEYCQTHILLFLTSFLILFGVWVVKLGEQLMLEKWGPRRRHTGEMVKHDYNETNWDEVVGMFCAALLIWPFRESLKDPLLPLMLIFVIFRLLDTFKPCPKVYAEKNPSFSVIIDDVAAGFGAGILVNFIFFKLDLL